MNTGQSPKTPKTRAPVFDLAILQALDRFRTAVRNARDANRDLKRATTPVGTQNVLKRVKEAERELEQAKRDLVDTLTADIELENP